ncbi:hypothetical protein [Miltoncostaea oceani]|uniref:hypothetical protein n=1 Tax=Miltoncostaea oceani TaxID=2843216 RepID=UPI001C3E3073|nr:hypothetical protein [Miltoncostaea oceani]
MGTLIVTGDLEEDGGRSAGAELWRVPFLGWDVAHRLAAASWCVPRRFTVIGARGLTEAAGYTNDPEVLPGERFTLRVESPALRLPG